MKFAYLSEEHEALSVGYNLGGIKSLLQIGDESLLVTVKWSEFWTGEDLGGTATLSLDGGQATGKDSFTDQGDWHAEIQGVDGSPLSSSLLAGRVENLVEERSVVGRVVVVEDVTGDFNEEGVEDALVPLGEDVTDLLVAETDTTLQDIVGLSQDLVSSSAALSGKRHTSQISCMSPYSIPLCTILTKWPEP